MAAGPGLGTLKAVVYVIVALSLRRSKGQSASAVVKRVGLHLGTPKDANRHRTIEWFGLEGTSKIIWFQPPCHQQGLLPPGCSELHPTWP